MINLGYMAIIWIAVAAIFAIIEAMTTGLTSIWFAGGAVAAGVVALVSDNLWIQFGVFMLVSILLLIVTRPFVRKHINGKVEKTNIDAIIGMKGIVVSAISPHENGAVRADGKVWTATSDSEIHAGSEVEIIGIKGVTLKVQPVKQEVKNV